jgi:16S rRNA (cytidine1402-2'-O)-methyltransferase
VGKLYVVSTPIGNLGDMTVRGVETLRQVTCILAEDTRHARTLLTRFDIATPTAAYHEHNEAAASPRYVARLLAGEDFALISDAGTPLLSDPGARLVRAAIEAGVPVVPVPGASALLAALVVSGLPSDQFTFFGFLPRRRGDRAAAAAAIAELPHTAVLYEAPNRTAATLTALADAGAGTRPAVVARELTKMFEEVRRGTVADLAAYYASTPARGEIVIVIQGRPETPGDERAWHARAAALRAAGAAPREIASVLVREDGVPRNVAYRLAHELEQETDQDTEVDEGPAGAN